MLLSRLTKVHPSGGAIEPPAERRGVTTPIRTSPSAAPGCGTVREDVLDAQAVELPLRTIEPPLLGAGT
jgi:hypothetical protein